MIEKVQVVLSEKRVLKRTHCFCCNYTTIIASINLDYALDLDSVLMKLNGRVNTEWYEFGVAIGLPTDFLDSLKSYPRVERMVELVDYWLKNHPDQPTWKEIADALEEMRDYILADSIKGIYDLASKR